RASWHVLLSIVCARNRGSKWLEKARNKQRKARKHTWRLRILIAAGVDGDVRRSCRDRIDAMSNMIPLANSAQATEFVARQAIGDALVGEALVADDNLSARYDLDRLAGVFSRPTHRLVGCSYVGRILVLNAAKGGVASAWML